MKKIHCNFVCKILSRLSETHLEEYLRNVTMGLQNIPMLLGVWEYALFFEFWQIIEPKFCEK